MKNTIISITATALLAACGASAPTDDLGKKRVQLDSLKTLYKEIGEQIKAADTWIAEHDTTVKKNLPSVTTLVLQPSTFEHFVEVHGNVKADKSADLFTMGGRVRRILVGEGDQVSKGQLLVELDNDAIARQLDAAEAGARLAKDVFERQSALWQQKIGSEMQYLQAKAQHDQAEASVAAVREQWRLSNVTAPFSGVIDDIMVTVGDMTSPMAPVARVVDPTGASLEADVPESYLQRVKKDDPVLVVFPSTGDSLRARLGNVSRYINPANRTFRVSVRMPDGGNMVRPNLLSVIHVRDLVMDSALVVPSRTIQEDVNGNNYVFILEDKDGKHRTRKVMVKRMADYKQNTMIGVVEGAAAQLFGTTIVDQGAKSVGDGQEVKLTNL
ncbi:MAG: efflux RND transporter periplasmic adaptor subunit [Flavobacteriales bacterium]|nr:efflux RND transporter periplasmic adaptor subunit [Flavobacteriales bacterium]